MRQLNAVLSQDPSAGGLLRVEEQQVPIAATAAHC